MKKCPNCHSEVDDNFDICWNCQYSFVDNKLLNNEDYLLICPNCNSEVSSSLTICSNCQNDLTELKGGINENLRGTKEIDCLRCRIRLEYKGNFNFHEGSRIGALGDLFELFTNRESFDLYLCPNCGKIEFFLPELK